MTKPFLEKNTESIEEYKKRIASSGGKGAYKKLGREHFVKMGQRSALMRKKQKRALAKHR